MIFVPESVRALRRDVAMRTAAGQISEREGFERVLQAYPEDPIALASLARLALDTGDLVAAERYARRAIPQSPCADEPYLVLGVVLQRLQPGSPLGRGYFVLGLEKVLLDSDRAEEIDVRHLAEEFGLGERVARLPEQELVPGILEVLEKEQPPEPAEVERELRPHRLVHGLRLGSTGLLPRAHVDLILANRDTCEPLLMGILKEYGEDFLEDEDYPMVERAIALLGEMGSQASLPAFVELQVLDQLDVSGPAEWAFQRVASQYPEEALAAVRSLIPTVGTTERMVLAREIALMASTPGRSETLAALEEGMERFPPADRKHLILCLIATYYAVEGEKGQRARALELKYGSAFSEQVRADLQDLRRQSLAPEVSSVSKVTVYDICCAAPPQGQPAREPARKPGRNAPCWCGSGRKYKNCHFARDRRS